MSPGTDPGRAGPPDTVVGAVVDAAVLERLAAELDDAELVRELVREYVDALPGRLALLDGPVEGARRAAHTLKSGAWLLGCAELAESAAVVEVGAGPDGDRSALLSSRRSLELSAGRAAQAWERWTRLDVEASTQDSSTP